MLTVYLTIISTFNVNINVISNINEIKLSIDVIIYKLFIKVVKVFIDFINNYSNFWIDQKFVKLSKNNWMRIFFKFDWKKSIKSKIKIYSFNFKNKAIVNNMFDEFQKQDKILWTTNSTLFNFFCFVVWKKSFENKKHRVVINVRDLNVIT